MFNLKKFPNQRPNEKVLIFLRRHWFVLFKALFLFIIFGLIPPVLYQIGRATDVQVFESIFNHYLVFPLIILVISIYYLFIWLFLYNQFIDYYLDVWIVTNQKVINIEQKNLFARIISVKELHKLQDATSEVKGFFPTLLNYGDVYIQTAGEKERFIFKQVPNAPQIAHKVVELAHREKAKKKI